MGNHPARVPSAYERRFAQVLGGEVAAFSFWKGRVALYAILRAMEIGPGDEVILPGFTCVVVPNAVRLAGGTPVYADVAPASFNVDPAGIERLLTSRTRAIVAQHTFGIPAAIDQLLELSEATQVPLIEDCAHTVAGWQHGRHLGTLGHAGFFSFQWSKPYTTGLGGMAVTTDADLAMRLSEVQDSFVRPPRAARLRLDVQYQLYSRFFTSRRYWLAQDVLRAVSRLGLFVGSSSEDELTGEEPTDHTWLMSASQQANGLRLVGTVRARADHALALTDYYADRLARDGWAVPQHTPEAPLLRYPMLVSGREDLLRAARSERIELGSWFESPLHPIPLESHATYGYSLGQCPHAERCAQQIVNLPLHLGVTHAEAQRIATFFIRHARRPVA